MSDDFRDYSGTDDNDRLRYGVVNTAGGDIMTNDARYQKVRPEHLKRDAYLYIRQSTIHQVFHNTESARRQYDLRRRATALGWADDNVIVIDSDLGQSGASAKDR